MSLETVSLRIVDTYTLYVAKNAFIETEVLRVKGIKPYTNVGYMLAWTT